MILKEQVDKVVALNNLRDATVLLKGKMSNSIIVDSSKKSFKRIIIDYDYDEKI